MRLIFIDHTPLNDELYHVLAARSWLQDGAFTIADGEYNRSKLYTVIIAAFIYIFGDNLVVARLPSLISGVLLVLLVFISLRHYVDRCAAWVAGLLLCFSPEAVFISQFARFYALHALLFYLGVMAVYRIFEESLPIYKTAVLLALAAGLLYLADQLQVTTLIGLAGAGIWVLLFALPRVITFHFNLNINKSTLLMSIIGIVALIVGGIYATSFSHIANEYLDAPSWAIGDIDNYRFYHYYLLSSYPLLWTLLPLAILTGLSFKRNLTLLFASIFMLAFFLHSFAGPKAVRYIFYTLPFFYCIWGIAFSRFAPGIRNIIISAVYAITSDYNFILPSKLIAWLLIIGSALFVMASNPALPLAFRMATRGDHEWPVGEMFRGYSDWEQAGQVLIPEIKPGDVILASSDVKAIYFLGRSDFVINRALISESKTNREFGRLRQTGRPVIGKLGSLKKLMACYETGIAIVEDNHWRADYSVTNEVADYLESQGERINLPHAWHLHVYRWEHKVATPLPIYCDAIYKASGSS